MRGYANPVQPISSKNPATSPIGRPNSCQPGANDGETVSFSTVNVITTLAGGTSSTR